ncbi:hypothetical protein CU102_03205 [Phyllobacterium brassicacearum]|uniref:Uncharacterized protein n=1 Tax=Phyllobacterium brassicacearum TaxID=314235 RepID=A0A2P7BUI9_9HYPH|nr:hypothetical protein CU102_03205 [Phyllobacterium brassicacearum]TDQ34011.1 hypothetical protein DEV91_104214 [Phyllobacterium brassicacearum]
MERLKRVILEYEETIERLETGQEMGHRSGTARNGIAASTNGTVRTEANPSIASDRCRYQLLAQLPGCP